MRSLATSTAAPSLLLRVCVCGRCVIRNGLDGGLAAARLYADLDSATLDHRLIVAGPSRARQRVARSA